MESTQRHFGGDVAAVQAQQESVIIEEVVQQLTTQSRQFRQTNAAGRNKRQCGLGGGGGWTNLKLKAHAYTNPRIPPCDHQSLSLLS